MCPDPFLCGLEDQTRPRSPLGCRTPFCALLDAGGFGEHGDCKKQEAQLLASLGSGGSETLGGNCTVPAPNMKQNETLGAGGALPLVCSQSHTLLQAWGPSFLIRTPGKAGRPVVRTPLTPASTPGPTAPH